MEDAAIISQLFPSINDCELMAVNGDDLSSAIVLTNVNDLDIEDMFNSHPKQAEVKTEKNGNYDLGDLLNQSNSEIVNVRGCSQAEALLSLHSEKKYYEYRSKNNIASRKARISRKVKNQESEHLAQYLRQENARLREMIIQLTRETFELKKNLTEKIKQKFNGD